MLEAAWIPHSRFHGDGRLALEQPLAPGAHTTLAFTITADEPAGTRVDNAFVILRVLHADHAWRVFTRMRIEFDAAAAPHPIRERVTMQPAE
jgi:hypothetical protein